MLHKQMIPIASLLLLAGPALATSISYEIDAEIHGLDFGEGPVSIFEQGIGFATFEGPTEDGLSVLVDFEINILTQTFVEQDASGYPDEPLGTVVDNELVGIDFFGTNVNGAFLMIDSTFVFSMYLAESGHLVAGQLSFRPTPGGGGGASGGGAAIPEPSAALIFAAGIGVVARRRRVL
jgi:hypothetical protein